jgi:hypothetical protein
VLPGYVSRVAMIPDLDLGVAVLTNQESEAAHGAIAWHVLDQYIGAPAVDWIAGYKKLQTREQSENKSREQEQAAARNASSRPSLPLSDYAGVYADAWYGEVGLTLENGGLVIRFSHTPRPWSAISCTGSTTPSSPAGETGSCTPMLSSPSP